MKYAATLALCPRWGNFNRSGEFSCSRCGALLGPGLTTLPLTALDNATTAHLNGILPSTTERSITLQIDAEKIVLPIQDAISLGRIVPSEADEDPCDIDLAPFGAANKGISRKHMLIRRKNGLAYVTDLGSTNGTWLNSHRLLPNMERLLHTGDELKLGLLIVKVKF